MRKKKHKADRSAIERFGCWKRILPSDDDEEYLTFTKAKYLFDRLMNKKGASAMTLVCFGKIAKISCLKNLINRVQIDLLYKRVTQMNKTSQMDLNTFFDAMEELANQLFPGRIGKCDALIDTVLENIKEITPQASSQNGPRVAEKNYMSTTKNRKIAAEQTQGTYQEQ